MASSMSHFHTWVAPVAATPEYPRRALLTPVGRSTSRPTRDDHPPHAPFGAVQLVPVACDLRSPPGIHRAPRAEDAVRGVLNRRLRPQVLPYAGYGRAEALLSIARGPPVGAPLYV